MRIIFSSEFYKNTDAQNIVNTNATRLLLDALNIHYTACQGMYRGVKEYSLMVEGNSTILDKIRSIARLFGQESILVIQADDSASLHYLKNNKVEHLGLWSTVDTIENLDAWTWVDGRYHTIK